MVALLAFVLIRVIEWAQGTTAITHSKRVLREKVNRARKGYMREVQAGKSLTLKNSYSFFKEGEKETFE